MMPRLGAQLGALRWMGRVLTEHASGARRQRVLQQAARRRHARRQRLDRLGRSILHLVDIARTLKQRDIGLCSLQESIDTTRAGGQLVFHIFGSLAEFESELIAAPVGAGTLTRGAGGTDFPTVRTRREGVGYDPREPPYLHAPASSPGSAPAENSRDILRPVRGLSFGLILAVREH